MLTDAVDWGEMEIRAQKVRAKKLKNAAGRPPRLRATFGALVLRAIRQRPGLSSAGDGLDAGLRDGGKGRQGGGVWAVVENYASSLHPGHDGARHRPWARGRARRRHVIPAVGHGGGRSRLSRYQTRWSFRFFATPRTSLPRLRPKAARWPHTPIIATERAGGRLKPYR